LFAAGVGCIEQGRGLRQVGRNQRHLRR
jgi:hypothetical protein